MPNAVSNPLHFVKQNTLNLTRFIRNEINTKNSKVLERYAVHFVDQKLLSLSRCIRNELKKKNF